MKRAALTCVILFVFIVSLIGCGLTIPKLVIYKQTPVSGPKETNPFTFDYKSNDADIAFLPMVIL